jgi:hypothetical protein
MHKGKHTNAHHSTNCTLTGVCDLGSGFARPKINKNPIDDLTKTHINPEKAQTELKDHSGDKLLLAVNLFSLGTARTQHEGFDQWPDHLC